jgi:integrase
MTVRVGKLMDEYLAAHGPVLAPATVSRYRAVAKNLEGHFGAKRRVDTITRTEASGWRASLNHGQRQPTTIARSVGIARMLVGEMVDQDRLADNPFDRLRVTAPQPDGEWPVLAVEHVHALMDRCGARQGLRSCIALCGLCGLRVSQALALTWGNVDLAGNRLAVDAQRRRRSTKFRLHHPPIEPDRCPSGMHEYLSGIVGLGEDLVCGHLSHNTLRRVLPGIIAAAVANDGVPHYPKPFHGLRRSVAVRWANHYPEHVVAAWLGHSLAVSMRHYRTVDEGMYARRSTEQ